MSPWWVDRDGACDNRRVWSGALRQGLPASATQSSAATAATLKFPVIPCSRKGPIGETAINRGNCLSAGPGEFEFLVKFPVNGVRHPETRSA